MDGRDELVEEEEGEEEQACWVRRCQVQNASQQGTWA
jgi:hypothetical protein